MDPLVAVAVAVVVAVVVANFFHLRFPSILFLHTMAAFFLPFSIHLR